MITVARQPIPVASAHLVSLVLHRQTRPAAPMGRNLVPTVAAVPDCAVKGIPILTLVRMATRRVIPGEVRLRRRPRPVPAVLLREPVTKLRRTPTVTAVPADTLRPILGEVLPEQLPKFVPVVQLPAPVTGHVCLSLVRYVLKLYQKTAVIPKFLMTVAAEPSLVLFLVHAVWLYRHVQKKDIPAT